MKAPTQLFCFYVISLFVLQKSIAQTSGYSGTGTNIDVTYHRAGEQIRYSEIQFIKIGEVVFSLVLVVRSPPVQEGIFLGCMESGVSFSHKKLREAASLDRSKSNKDMYLFAEKNEWQTSEVL